MQLTRSIFGASLALSAVTPAFAGDCDTLQSCIAAAQAKLSIAAGVEPAQYCSDDDQGCLVVSGEGIVGPVRLPTNGFVAEEQLLGRTHHVLESGVAVMPRIELGRTDKINGDEGVTVAVQFFAKPRPGAGIRGLFGLADGNRHEFPIQVAVGHDDKRFYLGSRSSYSKRWFWIPLWDPKPPQAGWSTLFVTFQNDGKTRFDLYAPKSDPDGSRPSITSSLVDFGWPIAIVPQGNGKKEFLPASQLWLGAEDGVAEGISQISLYKRPLTVNERRAVHTDEMQSVQLPFEGPKEACNTGSYLNDRAYDQSIVQTVCGMRESTLYAVTMGGEYWPHYTDPGRPPLYITMASPSEFHFLDYKSIFPGEQRITFEAAGGRYFYIRHNTLFGDVFWTQRGEDIAGLTVKYSPANPSQLWYVLPYSNGTPYRFLSAGNGGFISAPFELLARVKAQPLTYDIGWRMDRGFTAPSEREKRARKSPVDPAWANVKPSAPVASAPVIAPADPEFDEER